MSIPISANFEHEGERYAVAGRIDHDGSVLGDRITRDRDGVTHAVQIDPHSPLARAAIGALHCVYGDQIASLSVAYLEREMALRAARNTGHNAPSGV